MDSRIVVDLSDETEIENNRKKLDRKKFNEVKKYIPFLEFITTQNPVKNDKYVKLLQWFKSKKELPARMAATCENAIKKRYQTLKLSTVFPPNILSIFEGGEEAIDLISDDDDESMKLANKNLSAKKKCTADKTTVNCSNSIELKNKQNEIVKNESLPKKSTHTETNSSVYKPSASTVICIEKNNISTKDMTEEGEVISDCENVLTEEQQRKKKHSISLSEISLKTIPNKTNNSKIVEVSDDIINQELFNKIDNLAGDTCDPIGRSEVSGKDLEKEDSVQCKTSPILRSKNLESFCRKSPEYFSNISDDDEPLNEKLVQKKKKKKHKHKKKSHYQAFDSYDGSETENHLEKKTTSHEHRRNNVTESRRKQKKTSKRRPVYVSDDDDELLKATTNSTDTSRVESKKATESELFQRRDLSVRKTETSISDSVTVVLLDSDEDEVDTTRVDTTKCDNANVDSVRVDTVNINIPNTELKTSPVLCTQKSSNNSNCELLSNPIVEEMNLLDKQKKEESSSPNKLKNLNNMGLNELNDIYYKLCEKTGIQLEELLGDLVNKSSINNTPTIQNTNISSTDFGNDSYKLGDCLDSLNLQQDQFQKHQLHQQNLYHSQQKQLHHFLQQQEQQHFHQQQQFAPHFCSSNQMHNNTSLSYSYQNSLMPRLNLNDPRIVLKLKQIKDSPIHNLSIRESASLLMNNCFNQRPPNRTLPEVVKVTSNTATTYGEHKRLKEREKQIELERQSAKQNEAKETIYSPVLQKGNASEAETTNTTVSKKSSGPESCQNMSKKIFSIENKCLSSSVGVDQSKTKEKPKRKNSSASESDRKTPIGRKDSQEKIIMSFSGRPRSRQRIESSSSSASNETTDLQPSKCSNELNLSGRITPFHVEKIVEIVNSALGKTKEKLPLTPSKSRKNSIRNSTDSNKRNTKLLNSNDIKTGEELNKDEENVSSAKSGKRNSNRSRRKTIDQSNKTTTKLSQPKRGCRELDNLNCTFKEYSDMFEKCLLPTIGGKRLCSSSGFPKQTQFDSSDSISERSTNIEQSQESAVFEQDTPSKHTGAALISRRRQTFSTAQTSVNEKNKSGGSIKVCFRRVSESGRFSVESKNDMKSSSDETDEFDIEEHRKIKISLVKTYKNVKKDPFNPFLKVTLQRLSPSEMKKWTTNIKEDKSQASNKCYDSSNVLSIQSAPVNNFPAVVFSQNKIDITDKKPENNNISKIQYGEMPILVPFTSKPVNTPKKQTPKAPIRLNNDISMTLNSTKTCVLCNKRPLDLTNHYIVQHQTESYTSRLTSGEIENLESNINLAIPHRNRYRVKCPFCPEQDELEDNFVNFHAHFSFHTGEYGFKCDVCDMVKPFREDISSHQKRSSTCRNGKIRSNYLYSPDLVVIYLYVCNICNFVQLNEANIYKHHRDHHGIRFDEPQNVKKCIIAAIDNGEVLNEIMPADQEEEFPLSIEKDPLNVEQEFVSEYPLDIKDVLLTENQEAASTSEISSFENLLQEINVDNEAITALTAATPEALFEQLHANPAKPASSIITVVHNSNTPLQCQEIHKPYLEPIDKKPIIKENKPILQTRMIYRKMPSVSNYFGMYKCTLNDCWFSTNEAERFYKHIESAHNSATRKIFLDCAYCPFKSTSTKNIVNHVRAKHIMCRYQCAECAYRSTIPGNVVVHRRVYHKDYNSSKNIYECASRVKELDKKLNDLMKKVIDNVSSLKCPDCSKCFYAIESIKSHILKEHPLSFQKLNTEDFKELVCMHCNEESNSKDTMRVHLALDHPDEIGYVIERKLRIKTCADAASNLTMVNISLLVAPADIQEAIIEECNDIANTMPNKDNSDSQTPLEDAPPSKVIKLIQEISTKPINSLIKTGDDHKMNVDVSLHLPESNIAFPHVSTIKAAAEEKRLKPLLELLTENTGAPPSSLYRCPECIASFLHYELWKKHIITRHQILESVSCPYCANQFKIDLAVVHFESHRRHEYICFHCVASFCSREKICEHFASFHSEFRTTIEKKISFVDSSFYIFKEKDASADTVNWLQMINKLSEDIRCHFKLKMLQNQHKEWWAGLSYSCHEDLEIPQYFANGHPRYKCLVRSCTFIGSDEDTLDAHMRVHDLPERYKCSQCAVNQKNPTWENLKDHKMLHKQELNICCVCKFLHHSFAKMLKHIEQLHKMRDVPVISIWRDETNYKTSLAIVLPENKISFATSESCFCCRSVIKNNTKLVQHLRKEHKITLCLKCQICEEIILTHKDAEAHAIKHQMTTFKLKYEVWTPFLYNLITVSLSPFILEARLIKEKRSLQDPTTSTSKKTKPDEEETPIQIKQEVYIKSECEEIVDETPSASIKCVDLQNLIRSEENTTHKGSISVKAMSVLRPENSHHLQYQTEPIASNHIVVSSNTGHNVSQNNCISNIQTPHRLAVFSPSQLIQIGNNQLQPIFRATSPQITLNQQQPQNTVNLNLEPNIPELAPICGICNYECTDFLNLKSHYSTMHAYKNDRFLFRIARKVECVYCSFRCSLGLLSKHHETYHFNMVRRCRSVVEPNRCGVCHEVFSASLICACPKRERCLADCLDLHIFKLLQNFGQPFLKYTCDICQTCYNLEHQCKEHIVQVHKINYKPKVSSSEVTYVCFSCEETNKSMTAVVNHINRVHLQGSTQMAFDDRTSVYNKIQIIYPRGLTLCFGDLKNTGNINMMMVK